MTKKPVPTGVGLCRLCGRWQGVQYVCMLGHGPKSPELVIIAEAPSKEEDRIGRPLVGPAGKLLDRALVAAGYDLSKIYRTNSVRCGSQPAKPKMTEIRKCRMYLTEELSLLDLSQCIAVIVMGETAIKSITDDAYLSVRETRLRRLNAHTIIPITTPVFATYHPSAALPHHQPDLFDEIVEDLKAVRIKRDLVKPVVEITSEEELGQFDQDIELGIDLEWRRNGSIRMIGVSNGQTNALARDPKVAITWLQKRAEAD